MLLVFIITKQTQLVVKVTWIVKVSVLLKSLEVSACERGFIQFVELCEFLSTKWCV